MSSTEITQNSDSLNTFLPTLTNVNTPLPRLQRQLSVHFNTEPVIYISTQPAPTKNQNTQITPQKLVDIVRQLSSHDNQQITSAQLFFIYRQRLHKHRHL